MSLLLGSGFPCMHLRRRSSDGDDSNSPKMRTKENKEFFFGNSLQYFRKPDIICIFPVATFHNPSVHEAFPVAPLRGSGFPCPNLGQSAGENSISPKMRTKENWRNSSWQQPSIFSETISIQNCKNGRIYLTD